MHELLFVNETIAVLHIRGTKIELFRDWHSDWIT